MSKIIQFRRPEEPEAIKEEPNRWGNGQLFCISCRHEWVGPFEFKPEELTQAECPNCGRFMGQPKYHFVPPNEEDIWYCDCGNNLFMLTEQGHLCPACGTYQRYD